MNCPYCGDINCPGAFGCECAVVRPMLSEQEFIKRLTDAGWKQWEAEEKWQSIQDEQEGGL